MKERIKKSLWPYGSERIFARESYDLYGPIWIMITLIIMITIIGFIRHQIHLSNVLDEENNMYNLGKIMTTVTII